MSLAITREPGFRELTHLWNEAGAAYASWLTYVETRAALAARERATGTGAASSVGREPSWTSGGTAVDLVEFDELLAKIASLAAERHHLRGADAVHLAAAATLGSGVAMVTLDQALRSAALAAGMDVAP